MVSLSVSFRGSVGLVNFPLYCIIFVCICQHSIFGVDKCKQWCYDKGILTGGNIMADQELTKTISVRVTETLHQAIQRKADRLGLNSRDIVRMALAEYTKSEQRPEPVAS